MSSKKTIYTVFDINPGRLEIQAIEQSRWGGTVRVSCVYAYPPEHKPFTLRFERVRSINWIIVNPDATDSDETHVLTHDLGEEDYQRTARFATTLCEIIISYERIYIEKDW